jgi:hypothetical protein
VPVEILEEADALRLWAERAVAVAARKTRKRSSRSG